MSFDNEFDAILNDYAQRGIYTDKTFIYIGAICPGCKTKAKLFKGCGAWLNSAGRGVAVYILCIDCIENHTPTIAETARKYVAIAMKKAGHVGEDQS